MLGTRMKCPTVAYMTPFCKGSAVMAFVVVYRSCEAEHAKSCEINFPVLLQLEKYEVLKVECHHDSLSARKVLMNCDL